MATIDLSWKATLNKDITAGKHGGNAESAAAHEQVKPFKAPILLDIVALYEKHGQLTAKEVSDMMGRPFNAISGRVTELKQLGKLKKTGIQRDGSAVLELV